MNQTKLIIKVAGYSYLFIFLFGIFANFFVIESMVVPGNAAETTKNIIANESLYRIGIFSFVLMVIFDALVAWALYILLKPVNENVSLLAAWLRVINCSIFGIALYSLINVLHLISSAEYLAAIEISWIESQIMLSINSFNSAWLIGLVFFGIHLSVLGYLIYKSGYIPKIIGVLLVIASIGYLIDSFANFLLSSYNNYKDIFTFIVIVPGIIGELSFTLWLIFKSNKMIQLKGEL